MAESRLSDTCCVVFDRRSVEFLPPFQLALQIGKRFNTIVVDGACSWRQMQQRPLARRVRKVAVSELSESTITLYKPFLLPEKRGLSRVTRLANLHRLKRELRYLTKQFRRIFVIFDNAQQLPLVGTLGESVSAYYLYDDFAVDLTGQEHGLHDRVTEAQMIKAVGVVFPVSKSLCAYAREHSSNVHYLPNGYNADLFRANTMQRLQTTENPVIGFAGVISGRVDLVGLRLTAMERPDWTFQLLGYVSNTLTHELEQTGRPPDLFDQLLRLPNVEHLSPRPLAEVPEIVAGFDVGLVPYCLNRFTLASSPLKVYEYYAMGLPVVTTAVPEVVAFDPDISIVSEGQSYADAIQYVLDSQTTEELRTSRIGLAARNSTAVRAESVLHELKTH